MASAPIANPSTWLAILNKLGIPRFGTWSLLDTVQPVALVDSEVVLTAAAVTPAFGTPASAGELTAPAANTRLADTGALVGGNWSFLIVSTAAENYALRIRRRNAADAADVWSSRLQMLAGSNLFFPTLRSAIGAGERIVVENIGAGGAGIVYQASIFAVLG